MAPPDLENQRSDCPPTAADFVEGRHYIGRREIVWSRIGWVYTTDEDGYTLERIQRIDRSLWDSGTPENPTTPPTTSPAPIPPVDPNPPVPPVDPRPPTPPVPPVPVPTPTMSQTTGTKVSERKIRAPNDFDGNCAEANTFINDCQMYLRLNKDSYC